MMIPVFPEVAMKHLTIALLIGVLALAAGALSAQ